MIGTFIASALHHTNPQDLNAIKHANEVIDDNYERLGRFVANMGYNILKHAGLESEVSAQYLKKVATVEEWNPVLNQDCDIVLQAVIKHLPQEKEAAMLGTAMGMGTDAAKLLSALVLLGGAGLGTAYWGAERSVDEDNLDIDALKTQIGVYDQLSQDVDSQLKTKFRKNEQNAAA